MTLVVVGAGLAGAKAAEAARAAGYDGRVVLVGDEASPPYERPPLSKQVLRGEKPAESARVHDEGFYDEQSIELRTGQRVEELDVGARTVHVGDEVVPYDSIVLATGARPRRLDVPGADLEGTHYLRTVEDSARLGEAIKGASRIAVIGGSWIGSEVAASARQLGAEVVMIEPSPTPLFGVLGGEIGQSFAQLHRDHGVSLRMGIGVSALQGSGHVDGVVLEDGSIESADLVVIGVGALPNTELAEKAGLKVDNGVVVDERLIAVPGVLATGDVASAYHPRYGRHVRVEHWANALNQGQAAGRNAVSEPEVYDRLPYFYSDQYDLGLEYVGWADASTSEVAIRGSLATREFIAFYHQDGVVNAALAVNTWEVIEDLKTIVAANTPADLTRLTDPDTPLL